MACGWILTLAGTLVTAGSVVVAASTARATGFEAELMTSSKRTHEAIQDLREEMYDLRRTNSALVKYVKELRAENEQQSKQIAKLLANGGSGDIVARVLTLERWSASLDSMLTVAEERDQLIVNAADLIINAGNLYVQNGTQSTVSTDPPNGLGNIIIGYDESGGLGASGPGSDEIKLGSHNLIVGPFHSYTSYGGIVAGADNAIVASSASVVGGQGNAARGPLSAVLGGGLNLAAGEGSAVCGGAEGAANGFASSVSGGQQNVAGGDYSAVSGGTLNSASGDLSTVSGGQRNQSRGTASPVGGGERRQAPGLLNWAAGPLLQNR